jgi:hypothetical protein
VAILAYRKRWCRTHGESYDACLAAEFTYALGHYPSRFDFADACDTFWRVNQGPHRKSRMYRVFSKPARDTAAVMPGGGGVRFVPANVKLSVHHSIVPDLTEEQRDRIAAVIA